MAVLTLVGCAAPDSDAPAPARVTTRYSILDYGAIGDGQTLDTRVIQETIDRCAAGGGGVVVVPTGVFLSGAIFFKPGVQLTVEKGGVLKGSPSLEDYPQVRTRWEGVEREWTAALVNFIGLTGVELTGEGTIDGSGTEFAQPGRRAHEVGELPLPAAAGPREPPPGGAAAPSRGRPRLIALQSCRNARVAGLHLQDQASWGLFMVYCENVVAENLIIRAAHTIPSSDGIDIDSCRSVRVTACDIDVNDDCISLKSGRDADGRRVNRPCEDIVIERTRFGYGHGGVALGSEVSGGIRRVEVRDCVAEAGNWAPIRCKSQPSRGGVVEDIVYRNLVIHDARQAFEFELAWRMVPPLAPPADPLTIVRRVRLINITGTVAAAGKLHGLPGSPITDVKFENCQLAAGRGLVLENTRDVDTSGLALSVQEGEAILRRAAP